MTFAPRRPRDIVALIDRNPLAWVVSRDFDATLLPLLAECDAAGTLTSLLGHYPWRNPQVAAFGADGSALILFGGPQGYVSPTLVSEPAWGPTWNYAALRIVADVEFVPAETETALRRLSGHMEPDGAWRVEAMGTRFHRLATKVVAFRATILSCEATFKLGQDESDEAFADIVGRHADAGLVRAMQDQRTDGGS